MSRPQTEADYLARLIPPSVAAHGVSRRSLLKGALGVAAAAGLPAVLASCSSSGSGSGGSGATGGGGGSVGWGTNESGTRRFPFTRA